MSDEIEQPTDEIEKRGRGQPSPYRADFARIAREMCSLGATDYQLAVAFGVDTQTIWQWTVTHKEFSEALKIKKNEFDDVIERRLAERAAGYTYHTEKVHVDRYGNVTRIPVVEHVPPDAGAARAWLAARRANWKEGATVNVNVSDALSDDELARRLAAILAEQGKADK